MEVTGILEVPDLDVLMEEAREHWARTGEACYRVFHPSDFLDYWDEVRRRGIRPQVVRVAYHEKGLPAIILDDWRLVIVSCAQECE